MNEPAGASCALRVLDGAGEGAKRTPSPRMRGHSEAGEALGSLKTTGENGTLKLEAAPGSAVSAWIQFPYSMDSHSGAHWDPSLVWAPFPSLGRPASKGAFLVSGRGRVTGNQPHSPVPSQSVVNRLSNSPP